MDDISDPFVITSVDLKPLPQMTDEQRAAAARADNPFSSDAIRTAVHRVPDVRARAPMSIDEASTAVELPGLGTSSLAVTATHNLGSAHHAVTATHNFGLDATPSSDDFMSIDDSEVMAMDEEPTYAPPQQAYAATHPGFMAREASPVPMGFEGSRAETAIAHVPSLAMEPPPEESAVHRLHAFDRAVAPSFANVPNAPAADGTGLKTFVGRVDAATLAAASQGGDLDGRGGLSADGTYTPPQEPTRTTPIGFGLARETLDTVDRPASDNRRATRPIQTMVPGELDERRSPRGTLQVEVTRGTRIMRGVTTAALSLVLLSLAVFALVRSGQLDLAVLSNPGLVVRSGGTTAGGEGLPGVTPVGLRSIVYPTARGGSVLVFSGVVVNNGSTEVRHLDVIAEVRDTDGSVKASERGPVGVTLDVSELARLTDAASVRAAFAAKTVGISAVQPGQSAPYMVVIAPVPSDYRYYRHQVRLAQRASVDLATPATAAEAPANALEEPAGEPAAVDVEASPEDDAAARRAKQKAKRAKMKRKARGADAGDDGASE